MAEQLVNSFATNSLLIHGFVGGVSEQESVLQPPFEANCMNWVLGHIISRRHSSLLCLGQPPLWPEQVLAIYRSGSDPIRSEAQARPFAELISDLDESQRLLEAALEVATEEQLQADFENDRGRKKVIDHLKGFHWHETYHLGQMELLRAFIESRRAG